MNAEELAVEEKKRLTALLFSCHVNEKKMEMLEPVIENTAWMKAKLDDTREKIKGSSVAISYDNGGGQTGIRENPLFKGYQSLWKSYMAGMNMIMASLPQSVVEKEAERIDEPKTVLQLVRAKHKKEA